MIFLEQTARQIALDWLRPRIERGESIKDVADSMAGRASSGCWVQIGGYAWRRGQSHKLQARQVAVTKIGGVPCLYIFELADLFDEVLHPERETQISLF